MVVCFCYQFDVLETRLWDFNACIKIYRHEITTCWMLESNSVPNRIVVIGFNVV